MKKILCLISAVVVIILSCVTASAVGETKLELRIVSESESQVVFSLNFVSGTPVGAMDFDVNVNSNKLKVTKIIDGEDLLNVKLQSGLAVSTSNVDKVPASVTFAMIPGFGSSNGSEMFVITAKKLTNDKVAAGDIKIISSNCTTDQAEQIALTVENAFGTQSGDAQQGADDPAENVDNPATPDGSEENPVAATPDAQANPEESTAADGAKTDENSKKPSNSKVIILCVISALAVGGGAGVTYLFMKKSNNKSSDIKKERKEKYNAEETKKNEDNKEE